MYEFFVAAVAIIAFRRVTLTDLAIPYNPKQASVSILSKTLTLLLPPGGGWAYSTMFPVWSMVEVVMRMDGTNKLNAIPSTCSLIKYVFIHFVL